MTKDQLIKFIEQSVIDIKSEANLECKKTKFYNYFYELRSLSKTDYVTSKKYNLENYIDCLSRIEFDKEIYDEEHQKCNLLSELEFYKLTDQLFN